MTLEFSAFLVSWLYFNSLRKRGMVLIPVLLTLVAVSEAVGWLTARGMLSSIHNGVWYNIMTPVKFICIFLLFRDNTRSAFWKYVIWCFIGFTLVLLALYIFQSLSKTFNTLYYTIQAAMVACCCLHYLYECMNSNAVADVEKNPLFYLAMGTLLFYLGTLPLRSMYNYLYDHHRAVFWGYRRLSMFLNYIMYGLILFGILWAKKK